MINIPKGTKDVLPGESVKWHYTEDTLRGLALGKLQADYDNAPDDAARRTAALAARMLRAAIEGRDEA